MDSSTIQTITNGVIIIVALIAVLKPMFRGDPPGGYDSIIHKIADSIKALGVVGIIAIPLSSFAGLDWLGTLHSFVVALFFVLDIGLVIGFCYAFLKGLKYRPHFKFAGKKAHKTQNLRSAYFQDKWKKMKEKYFTDPSPDSMRLAIIEADATVDKVLKDFGFPGDTMADRLANFRSDDMKTLDKLWDAHRMRNEIVHKPGSGITVADGKKAIADYEAFLKELEVL